MGRMTGSQRRAAWREKFASTRTSTGRNTTSTTNSATEAVPETTGSTQQTTQVGAKRDSNYGNPKLLSYPLKRSTSSTEDSLLIQAVRYKPPKSGDGIGGGFQDNDGSKIGAGMDGISEKKDSISAGGKLKFNTTMGRSISSRYDRYTSGTAGYKQDTKFYIELPIPQQISDTTSVTWGESTMNLFTLMGMDLGNRMMTQSGSDTFDDVSQMLLQGVDIQGLENTPNLSQTLRTTLAGLAVNQFGANVTPNNVLSRGTGQILNSNKELLFDGVNLREFRFDVTFTPREVSESNRVKEIIRSLKQAMAAKAGSEYSESAGATGGIFVSAPDLFLLKYLSGGREHKFLNVFKPCALTSLSVNYTGNGNYATYDDGTPVHIKMQMTFKETNPIYAEDYVDNIEGVGY
tara:strand:- start:915 stop:2126 length:1212 start_codon:yes stop_codon:yes gene_type:complete